MNNENQWNRPGTALKYFVYATLILALEFLLYSIRWIILLFLVGIGLGTILTPAMTFIQNRIKVPKFVGAFLFLLSFTSILFAVSFLVFNLISDQLTNVMERLPDLQRALELKFSQLRVQYPTVIQLIESMDFGGTLNNASHQLMQGFKLGTSAIAGFIFTIVIALYTATNPDYYLDGFITFFPSRYQSSLLEILTAVSFNLRRWFQSQLIAIFTVGFTVALGLWLIGVDYWILFGVISGLLDIIPYVGSIVPATGALLVALANYPEKMIWIIVVFIIVHQFENHLLVPLLMKHRMSFPPIVLITFILIMAHWFGVIGILVTTGLFTVFRTLYLMVYLPWVNRKPL